MEQDEKYPSYSGQRVVTVHMTQMEFQELVECINTQQAKIRQDNQNNPREHGTAESIAWIADLAMIKDRLVGGWATSKPVKPRIK